MDVKVNQVERQTGNLSVSREDQIHDTRQNIKGTAGAAKTAPEAFAASFGNGADTGAYAARKSNVADLLSRDEKELTASRNMDIVLSHTLSEEDYKKAREDGYDPSEITAGETTTIVDHIKASLIKSGVEVSGVTDTLSRDQLTEITGSEAYAGELERAFAEKDIPATRENAEMIADALHRATELKPLRDESILYMVENELNPGIDHLYLAQHAAKGRTQAQGAFFEQGGYYQRVSGDAGLASMQGQIDKVIRDAGLDPAKESVRGEAEKLLSGGVTLTPAHLARAVSLREMQLPPDASRVIAAGAAAIADGKKAVQGDLTDPRSLLQKAAEIDAGMRRVTDEAIRLAAAEQEIPENANDVADDFTLRDMIDAQARLANTEKTETATLHPAQEARFLQARLQLEEVRLSMSISVNMTMLRSGFSIDTAPMTELIENLNRAIAQNAEALFSGAGSAVSSGTGALSVSAEASFSAEITQTDAASRYRLFTETNWKVSYLRTEMPVGVIGALRDEFKTDTLDDIFTGATTWKTANAAYETMQTEVRRDLGDSIKKAFRNADALLRDAGMDVSEDNLRAVRILGYNRMEITREAVSEVAGWDAKLNEVLEGLRPAAVLDLIRDGKNPLQMTLEELSDALREAADKSNTSAGEKYAHFLYKMEQAGQISEAERTSYIGIYRMFETLQRTDHAAIGTLLHTGAQMSIRNLLTATRTMRTADGSGIDVRATADVAGYEVTGGADTIDAQIEAAFRYYSAKADTAFAHIAPEKMAQMDHPEEASLPDFAAAMETLPADDAADRAFDSEQASRIREALHGDGAAENKMAADIQREAAGAALEANDIPLTAANLEAYQALQNTNRRDGGSLWNRLRESGRNTKAADILKSETDRLASALAGDGEVADIYSASTGAIRDALQEQMEADDISYVDYRALSLMHRQIGIAGRMAERGRFEIPVETASGTVSMHVTLKEESGQGSGVRISLETEEYGALGAQFTVRGQEVSGMITTTFGETPQVKAYMEGLRTRMSEAIAGENGGLRMDLSATSVLYGATAAGQPVTGDNVRGSSARTLFGIARIFTEAAAL